MCIVNRTAYRIKDHNVSLMKTERFWLFTITYIGSGKFKIDVMPKEQLI